MLRLTALLFLACGAAACTTTTYPRLQAPDQPTAFAYDDLDAVLARCVDEQGRLDQETLLADPLALERFYALVSGVGPDTHAALFPTEPDRLAYWINAYNTGGLVLIAEYGPIESIQDVKPPWHHQWLPHELGFFVFERLLLDGRSESLHGVAELIAARYEEPRARLALACGAVTSPPWPARAYRGATLDAELDAATRRFLADERNLRVDDAAQTVHVAVLLVDHAEEVATWMARNHPAEPATVLAFAARFAPEDVASRLRGEAAGYAVEPVAPDWTVRRPARP